MDSPVLDLRILVDGVDLAGDVTEYQFETPRLVHNLGDYFDGANFLGPAGFACCVRGVWNDEHTPHLAKAVGGVGGCVVTLVKDNLALEVPCDVAAFRPIRLADGREGWEAAFVLDLEHRFRDGRLAALQRGVAWKELVA